MSADPALLVERLTYRYPCANSGAPALDDLSLEVAAGEFVVLAGASASGKTTLLRAACGLVPHYFGGSFTGEVAVIGVSTRECGPAELATKVGFVAQDPETQVVSSTVRAELELPLELRGIEPAAIALAVEEAALALGIEALLERTTDALSGGELQRVALGAALVTKPALLLLDEPTSQLDPVAGDELLSLLRRLNEDWGVTVLLGEHRLERCLSAADRVVALADGRLAYDGPPAGFGAEALARLPDLAPPAARLFERAGLPEAPVTVKEARRLLRLGAASAPAPAEREQPPADGGRGEPTLSAAGLRVSLDPGTGRREVLTDVSLEARRGERIALMGRNGAGKSTLLRTCAGLIEASRGTLATPEGCALLSQRPDDYLVNETVADELPGQAGQLALAAVGLELDAVAMRGDPRDLSGGQRQRLALAIAMAGRGAGGSPPGLVCLDEPTRGLDRGRKALLARWITTLAESSAVIVATHDVEFAAGFADRVILLGDGELIADDSPDAILSGGWYFATEAARITDGAATRLEDAALAIRAMLAEAPRLSPIDRSAEAPLNRSRSYR